MALRKTPERFRYGQHLKVCEEADTCHATLSPFPSLDSNSFYPFGFSKREGRCMASMRRISIVAFFSLSSFCFPFSRRSPLRLFLLFSMERLSSTPPGCAGGLLTKKVAASDRQLAATWWRRRESNPRPETSPYELLRVQFMVGIPSRRSPQTTSAVR